MPKELAVLINVEKYFSGHQVKWLESYCLNPAGVLRINKQDSQKTDKIDIRNLCKHLSLAT
jgi:hypothetical protein